MAARPLSFMALLMTALPALAQEKETVAIPDSQVKFDLVHTTVTWALTEWQEVPQQAILPVPNPTGSPVICHSAVYDIWCFVPDSQY